MQLLHLLLCPPPRPHQRLLIPPHLKEMLYPKTLQLTTKNPCTTSIGTNYAALWIAKLEDAKERVPSVQGLVQICRDTYNESAIQMGQHMLSTIQWTLGHLTAEA